MKSKTFKVSHPVLLLLTSALAALVVVGCQARTASPPADQGATAPAASSVGGKAAPSAQAAVDTTLRAATVVLVTGEVSWSLGSERHAMEIGDEVPVGATVVTGDNAMCDLQFGSLATMRVEKDSTVKLREIAVNLAGRKTTAELVIGSVAAKVSKLGSRDRFNISTEQVLCGVRGTEFLVSRGNGGKVMIAVREGFVALVPPGFDPAALEERAAGKALSPLVDAAFAAVMAVAPVVKPQQETAISAGDLDKSRAALAPVAALIEKAIAEAPPAPLASGGGELSTSVPSPAGSPTAAAPPQEGTAAAPPPASPMGTSAAASTAVSAFLDSPDLKASIATFSASAAPVARGVRELSSAGSRALFTLDTVTLHATATEDAALAVAGEAVAGTTGPSGSAGAAPTSASMILIPVTIRSDPAGALIAIDGRAMGSSVVSVLESPGTTIRVDASLDGYLPASLEFTVGQGQAETRTVTLKAKAAPSGPQSQAAPQPVAKAPDRWSIEVTPANATVSVNGTVRGKGAISGAFDSSTPLSYEISLDGYEGASGSLAPIAGATAGLKVDLVPKAVYARFSAATARPVGASIATPSGVLFADAKGGLHLVSKSRVLWSVATGNVLSDNAVPVASAASAYVEGDRNLSIVALASGATAATVPLDDSTSALFGRRPAIGSGELYLGANDGIRVLDPATGSPIRILPMAEGSDMSPRVVDGDLVIVDRKGKIQRLSAAGAVKWTQSSKAIQPVALSVSVAGGTGYFADRKGLISAFDLASGKVLWSKPGTDGGKAVFDDLIAAGGAVWAYSKGSDVALSASTGDRLFAPIGGASAPPFLAGGLVWTPMQNGDLLGRDPLSGEVRKTLSAGVVISARPCQLEGFFVCPLATGEVAVLNPAAAK